MDPRFRIALVAVLGSALGVWIGVALAQEEHFVASLAALVSVWLILAWTGGPLAEAWLLGFLFFGYVVGNRGFAQLTPIANLPLFLSELGLAFAVPLVAMRGAIRQELPLRRDWLNGLLLFWLALACGRIVPDTRTYGFMALRDFALVYYVLYFFLAQALARHAPSRRLLQRAILVTFAVLPISGLLATIFPEFFLSNLLVNGVPLIFYKGDLLATFLYTGFVVLLPLEKSAGRNEVWRWVAAIISLVLGLAIISRASMVGLAVAVGWLAWWGCWRHAKVVGAVCAAGLLAVTVHSLLQKEDFTQTNAYAIYEAVASIGDFSGDRNYLSDASGDKGDNNRFRLIWWRNVAEETLHDAPVLGLGFGADLSRNFLAEYYPIADVDFSVRSPHNVFLTTFGRMGFAGALLLLGIYAALARSTVRAFRMMRDSTARQGLNLQAACWVGLCSACFGVVLEGPMGAIPLWIMLGLAHHAAVEPDAGDDPGTRDGAARG